jgi:hypothetical protein
MKNPVVKAALPVFFAILFSCCASAPKPASPDDCLVVIKSDFIYGVGMTQEGIDVRHYQLKFSGDYKPARIQKGYSVVVVREPAVRIKAIFSQVQSNSYTGNPYEYPVDIILPYKPGFLVVADFVFVKETKAAGGRGFMEYTSFRKITDQEREALLAQLRGDPAFVSWSK